MFISRFNRFFEKHSKITYLVLLIVIIATFVIFVTPGDVFRGGNARVTDLGEMYGKKLNVDDMKIEMQKTIVSFWLQYPQFFGRDLGLNNDILLNETLVRMRFLHAAKDLGLDNVSDEEVRDAIASNQAFFVDGKFSPETFKNALDFVKNQGLLASDFDQVVRDNIIIKRLQDQVTSVVTVTDEELDAVLAKYTLKSTLIPVKSSDAEPPEAEIQDFFANRRSEINLPATKNALVAVFEYDVLKERVKSDSGFAARVTPAEEEIQNYFNTNGERLFPGKQLAEVSSEIAGILTDEKVRSEARRMAADLVAKFKGMVEGEDALERQARFQREAGLVGARVTPCVVSTENTINGLPGMQPNLADKIRGQDNVGETTDWVAGSNYVAVAYVTEKNDTPMPSELPTLAENASTDILRKYIRDILLREKALEFFQREIKAPYEDFSVKIKALEADTSLDAATKQQQAMALESAVDSQLILKFFVPQTRDFVQLAFVPNAYRSMVPEFSEAELQEAYNARKDVYQKVKVRLARIFVKTAGLEGDALTAKEARLAEIQQKLKDGADFLTVAKEYNEDPLGLEDRSLRDLDSLPAAIRAAVTNQPAGQVGEVIQDADGSYIVKVLERQESRSFEEVKGELREELIAEASKKLSEEDAAKFAAAMADLWWTEVEKNEQAPSVAELFESQSKNYPLAKLESFTNVEGYNYSIPQEILVKVFTVTEKAPVSSIIVTGQESYVVALTGINPEHLKDPDPTKDPQAYITLLSTYADAMQMREALREAQNKRKDLGEALAEGMDFDSAAAKLSLKFDDLPAISQNDINTSSAVIRSIENGKLISLSELAAVLPTSKAGMILEPMRAERRFNPQQFGANPYMETVLPVGYQLIYIAGVDMEAAKSVDEATREALRNRMLTMKKSQVLNDYMVQLEAQSNTQLREAR